MAIRLPQMPQPEVPMPQKAPTPTQTTAAPFKPAPHSPTPTPAQPMKPSYDAVVKQLHDYEEAGVPPNHPDRLHALEQFFKTVSTEGGAPTAPTPPAPSAPMVSGNSLPTQPQKSHIPPRRDQAGANDRASFLPPVRTSPPPPLSQPHNGAQALPFRPAETEVPFRKAEPTEAFRPDRTPSHNRIDSLADKKKAPPMEDARLLKRRRTLPSLADPGSSFGERRKITKLEKITLLSALIIGALVVAYFARGLYQSKHQQAAQLEPASLARQSTSAPPPLTMAEQNEIKDIVYAFHEASTPEAKATFVADGFQMLERMASFYTANGVEPAEITIDPYLILVEQGAVDYFRGTGKYPDGRTVEFYAKRQGNDFVLDWPSVSGYSTMSWPTFLAEKPALPMEFRVVANKVDSGTSASQELALALSSPRMPEKVICYADAASLAGSELDQVFNEFGASPVKLTLKLAYAGAPGNDPRLVVTELVRKDWLNHAESL